MSFKFPSLFLVLMLGFMLLVAPVSAQDAPAPDPVELAHRLLGFSGDATIPLPTPIYKLGDKLQFWVSKAGMDTPVQITAELAAASVTAYVWVEAGTAYEPDKMATLAGTLDVMYNIFLIRSNYGSVNTVPRSPADLNGQNLFQMPDVDNDPHLFILYANDLAGDRTTIFDPANSLETDYVPGGYTNEHEMVLVNMSKFPKTALDDPTYINVLARQFYATVAYYNNPSQPAWLRDAAAWVMYLQIQQQFQPGDITADDLKAFLDAPETPITRSAGLGSSGQEFGAGQLFLRYIFQRFGIDVFRAFILGSGKGLTALDDALDFYHVNDLVTGELVTAREVFADFVMANALNRNFGDGRYYHVEPAMRGQIASVPLVQDQFNFDLLDEPVSQLGTNYRALQATKAANFTIFFSGNENIARLPMPAGDEGNHFC